jgi:magnesium transporter
MADVNLCQLLIPEIRQLIQEKRLNELKNLLSEINPIDIADTIPLFGPEERLLILRLLKPATLASVFAELDLDQQNYVVQHLEDQTIAPLLEGIPADSAAKLLNKLSKVAVRRMSRLMSLQKIETVAHIKEYPKSTVGAIMRTNFFYLFGDMTVRSALERARANLRIRQDNTVDVLYVVNDSGRYIGTLSLQRLISAPPEVKVREVMTRASGIKVAAAWDQEEAAKLFSKYKLVSAPVVDDEDRLIGVLSADQVIQVIQQEATEDIQKLAGVEALDEPYFQVAFSKMIKKRGIWLCVLFVGETLTATAMGFFEGEIEKAVVLALFVPLIISSGGNSGSQAATLIVRAMALKEVAFGDWWRVVRREFASGLVLGSILGLLGFLRIALWSQFTPVYGEHYLLVGITVGVSLVLVVLWGTLSGSALPIVLRRIGLDPAVASAPFVATLVDVTGLIVYFVTASLVLSGTLL